jgi:folate-binding protein YgfZ
MPRFFIGPRSLFSIHGTDAVRYLNGQITQDVRRLLQEPHRGLPTCVTDAKGKLQAYATIYLIDAEKPTIWLETSIELRESLFARLSRYLIADDAEIDDISDNFFLTHTIGEQTEGSAFAHSRFGVAGFDQWLPSTIDISAQFFSPQEQAENLRILQGIPAWGHELVEGILPPEAGLEVYAISYHKGCYIGQEVISRIKSAGKTNRRLQRFTLASASNISLPASIFITGQSHEKAAGTLTSVAFPDALGFLHKSAFQEKEFDLQLADGSNLTNAVSCIVD